MNNTLFRTARLATSIVLVLLLLLLSSLANTNVAHAAGILVTNTLDDVTPGNGCSLREAITNANNNAQTYADCAGGSGADTITFGVTSPATITLTSALPTITDSASLTIDATGQSITISGGGLHGLFSLALGANVTLTNLTLANGYLDGSAGPVGAAINNDRAVLAVNSSTFTGNIVTSIGITDTLGGAIYNSGNTTLTNVTFTGNQANQTGTGSGYGGAIYNEANYILNLTNATFTGNTAKTAGGAIYNAGYLTISTGTFAGNSSASGGGLYNTLAPFRFSSVDFLGNSASSAGAGGAIQNYGHFIASINTVRIVNNTGVNCGGDPFTEATGGNLRWPTTDTTCLTVPPIPAIMYGNPNLDARSVTLTPPGAALSGDPGAMITYTLRVTNTGNVMDTYNISSAPNTWALSYPSSIGPLNAMAGADVPINVTVPPGAPVGITNTAVITLTSQISSTVAASSVLTTTANPLRALVLTPATAARSGNPGSIVTYTLQITNTGNISDTYNLTATPSQWVPSGPASVGPLNPGMSSLITVTVPISATAGGQAIDSTTITAASAAIPATAASSTLTTTANTVRGVTLAPSTSTKSGGLGTTITHTLRITNTGNLPDTFTLAASGNQPTWPAVPQPNLVSLNVGAGADITVSVTIYSGATASSTDTATITAKSQNDNTKTAAASLTTTATSVLPGIQTYVVNTGNINMPITNAQPGASIRAATYILGSYGPGSVYPSGTVTFTMFSGMGCSTPQSTQSAALNNGYALSPSPVTVQGSGLSWLVAYSGDANYMPTTGTCTNLSLTKLNTSTTLQTSVNPGTAGQSITLTARVTSTLSITPIGTVTFTVGTTNVTQPLIAGSTPDTGVATFVTTFAAGTHTITVTYSGDGNYNTSTASGVLNVNNPFFLPFINK